MLSLIMCKITLVLIIKIKFFFYLLHPYSILYHLWQNGIPTIFLVSTKLRTDLYILLNFPLSKLVTLAFQVLNHSLSVYNTNLVM